MGETTKHRLTALISAQTGWGISGLALLLISPCVKIEGLLALSLQEPRMHKEKGYEQHE